MTFSILLFALLLAVSVFLFALMGYRLFTQAAVRYEERFRESAEANLKDLFIFIDPQKLFLFNLGILVVSAFLIWAMSGNLLVSLLSAALLAACPRMVYSVLRARRERSFSYALPDSMASVASMLRAGSNLQSALELMVKESSGPIRQEFGLLLRELKMGVDFNEALDNMQERMPGEDLRMLTAGMKIAREVGGSLADVLARLAETLRRKLEIEGKIKALTAMGKAQGYVMALLPLAVGFAIAQIEPEAMGKLFTTMAGWAVCAVVVVLELLGFWFIKKIVSIDV